MKEFFSAHKQKMETFLGFAALFDGLINIERIAAAFDALVLSAALYFIFSSALLLISLLCPSDGQKIQYLCLKNTKF